MHKSLQILSLLVVVSTQAFTQRGSLLGKVKSIREKLVFLDTTFPHYESYSSRSAADGFYTLDEAIKFAENIWAKSQAVASLDYSREYDTSGLLKRDTWYYRGGRFKDRYDYLYDSCDRMIQNKNMFIFGKDTQYTVQRFKYDYCGFLASTLETSTFLPDKFYYDWNIYDDNYHLINKKNYTEYGESSGEKFSYDPKGQLIARYVHKPYILVTLPDGTKDARPDEKGEDELSSTYEYDTAGNLIRRRGFSEGELTGSITWTYDQYNRKVGEYSYSKIDTLIASTEFTYDEEGRVLSKTYKSKSFFTQAQTFQYDLKTKMLVKTIYNDNGKKYNITYNYRFDEMGNWVEQVKVVDGKELFKRIREITYY